MSDQLNTSLAIVPRTFGETKELAEYLSNASLAPAAARKQPHNAMAMILAGAEIGLAPMAALRAYHVIEGVPRLTADMMHAVCLKRPDLVAYFQPVEQAPTRVTWKAKRRAEGAIEIPVTWDLERAKRLPNFGKGPWASNPLAMLNARAKAELARLVAPDIVGGLYAIEEETEAPDAIAAAPNYTIPPPPNTPAGPSSPASGPAGTTPSGKPNRTRKTPEPPPAASSAPVDVTPPSSAPAAAAGPPPEPEIVDAEIVDESPAAHAAPSSSAATDGDDAFGEAPPVAPSGDVERRVASYLASLAKIDKLEDLKPWRADASEWGKMQEDAVFERLKTAYGERLAKLREAAAAAGGAK